MVSVTQTAPAVELTFEEVVAAPEHQVGGTLQPIEDINDCGGCGGCAGCG